MSRAWLCWSFTLFIMQGCDSQVLEDENLRVSPVVVPPRLLPAEITPPQVDRTTAPKVITRLPKKANSTQVDIYRQAEGVVDILWVIDDSGSMQNQRATLVSNFDRFFDELLKLQVDFHMGVTSTNASDGGRLRGATPIITPSTPAPKAVFLQNTTFPDSQTRWEQGLRMAEFAVSGPNVQPGGANFGFLRPNAALAMIVVSDEDDSSLGTPEYYARMFRSTLGQGNERLVSFSTIGGAVPNGCYPPGEQNFFGGLAEPAIRYSEVSRLTEGVVGSICDSSFDTTLIQIAAGLNTLRRSFPLTILPIRESITVHINGVPVPQDASTGWQFDTAGQTIHFPDNAPPPPGSTIRIEYAF